MGRVKYSQSKTQEGRTMIDVHPPEHTPHSWRDFLIHIATIVLGLLIAIGLEQTVEAIHHAHQRHQLQEDLRQEAEQDVVNGRRNIDNIVDRRAWDLSVMAALRQARPQAGTIQVTLPEHPSFVTRYLPLPAVWSIAKSNGQAALLPETQAKLYERIQANASVATTAYQHSVDASVAVQKQEARLNIHLVPGATVTVPANEAASLLDALAGMVTALQGEAMRDAVTDGFEDAIAHGVSDQQSLTSYRDKEEEALRKRLQTPNEPF
jgi:hypothetical protein